MGRGLPQGQVLDGERVDMAAIIRHFMSLGQGLWFSKWTGRRCFGWSCRIFGYRLPNINKTARK
jgi:hypothetical protein